MLMTPTQTGGPVGGLSCRLPDIGGAIEVTDPLARFGEHGQERLPCPPLDRMLEDGNGLRPAPRSQQHSAKDRRQIQHLIE